MALTLTAKVHWYPTPEQTVLLQQAAQANRQGCHAGCVTERQADSPILLGNRGR